MAKNNRGGQKGRSGPPGNLNAARSILPTIRRLQRGKPLPESLALIAAISDREAEQLIADKGGLENMTGGEQDRKGDRVFLAGNHGAGGGSRTPTRVTPRQILSLVLTETKR